MRIATNISAISAQRSMRKTGDRVNQAYAELSSGSRINKAADDAAGLAISELMRSQIRSKGQAKRNANDSVSFLQVANGGLNEVHHILNRFKELAIQSSNDTVSDSERKMIDMEYQELSDEINRIATSIEFNGKHLLSDDVIDLDFQVDTQNKKSNRVTYKSDKLNTSISALGLSGTDLRTKSSSQSVINKISSAITRVSERRSELGAVERRVQSTINNLDLSQHNLEESNSRIRDTDYAMATSNKAKNEIIMNANTMTLAQANVLPGMATKLLG